MSQRPEICEMYAGLCRHDGGQVARYVVLDGLGVVRQQGTVAWSASGMARLLEPLQRAAQAGVEVVLGVLSEDAAAAEPEDVEVMQALGSCELSVRRVEAWMLDALWRSHKRRRHTLVMRAHCLAQVVLVATSPPRVLSHSQPNSATPATADASARR